MPTYPPHWPAVARDVKDAAGWTCARCSHRHEPESGHTLTVHHFNGRASDLRRWNLMPLCQRCHLSVQGRVNVPQAMLFAPSPWALPYIAGAIAAGEVAPPPSYSAAGWAQAYSAATGRQWPPWAPTT